MSSCSDGVRANRIIVQMNMDPVHVLSFLFMLGSLELGQDYRKDTLTVTQRRMLEDLNDFGIVHQDSSQAPSFYPTRLATMLTSDASALHSSFTGDENSGYIIVETNYRVYAYTTSPLQINILGLFTRLKTRFPNLIAGKITRASTRRAVDMGITADQIISYLTAHAHPQMRKHVTIMPTTVVDQIKLWQREGERMETTSGFLFKDFATQFEYARAKTYADEVGVLKWAKDEKRWFFVTKVDQVAAFLKAKQKEAQAEAVARVATV